MKSRVSRNVHPGDPVRYVLQTGELGLAAREPSSLCHCCCIRPAEYESISRRVTWQKMCQVCLDDAFPVGSVSRGDYFPPDGRRLRGDPRAELVKRVAAGEDEVEVLAELLVREGKGVAST